MGEKFIGSVDTELHASGAETEDGSGDYFDVPAETTELDLVIGGTTTGEWTVLVETEAGSIIHSFTEIDDEVDRSEIVSLGGHPGGGKIRARWVEDSAGSLTFTLTARETRSGIR